MTDTEQPVESLALPTGGATGAGGVLVLVLATLAALLVGTGAGLAVSTLAGVVGALVVVGGTRLVAAPAVEVRAAGSIGLILGTSLVGAAALVAGRWTGAALVLVAAVAVMVVGIEAVTGFDVDVLRPSVFSFLGSGILLLVAGTVVYVVGRASMATLVGGVSASFATISGSVLLLLVALQLEVITLSVLLEHASGVLEEWLPGGGSGRFPVLSRLGVEAQDIPAALWLFVGAQMILGIWFLGLPVDLAGVLTSTLPGRVVYTVLASGLLHAPLAIAIALPAAILGLEILRGVLVRWGGYDPPARAALATGGALVAVVTLVLAVTPVVGATLLELFREVGPTLGRFGTVGAILLSVGTVTLLLAFFLSVGAASLLAALALGWSSIGMDRLYPGWEPGLVFGSVLLFAAAVVGSELGAHPLVVFGTVALALLVADVGWRSRKLARQLDPTADTADPELVHLVGGVVVGVVGLGLAAFGLYVVVPALGGPGPTAILVIVLAFVALLSFLVAMR